MIKYFNIMKTLVIIITNGKKKNKLIASRFDMYTYINNLNCFLTPILP